MPYLFGLFGVYLAALSMNWFVDPVNSWSHAPRFDRRALPPDEVYATEGDVDDRLVRIAQIAAAQRTDLIVLGSSRSMLVDHTMFRRGTSFLNLGVSNSSIHEFAAFWQLIKEKEELPRRIILFTDPWLYFREDVRDTRRHAIAAYGRYVWANVKSPSAKLADYLNVLSEEINSYFTEFEELSSWPVLRASLKALYQGRGENRLMSRKMPAAGLPDGWGGWNADGSYIYPASKMNPDGSESFEAELADQFLGRVREQKQYVDELQSPQFSEPAFAFLRSLVERIKSEKVDVLVVFSPYAPAGFARDQSRKYLDLVHQSVVEKAVALWKANGTAVCDMFFPSTINCTNAEFVDFMHMRKSCVRKLIHACLDGAPGWNDVAPVQP